VLYDTHIRKAHNFFFNHWIIFKFYQRFIDPVLYVRAQFPINGCGLEDLQIRSRMCYLSQFYYFSFLFQIF